MLHDVKCVYYIKCKCITKVVAAAVAAAAAGRVLCFCQEVFGMTSKEHTATLGPARVGRLAQRVPPNSLRFGDRAALGKPVWRAQHTQASLAHAGILCAIVNYSIGSFLFQ